MRWVPREYLNIGIPGLDGAAGFGQDTGALKSPFDYRGFGCDLRIQISKPGFPQPVRLPGVLLRGSIAFEHLVSLNPEGGPVNWVERLADGRGRIGCHAVFIFSR